MPEQLTTVFDNIDFIRWLFVILSGGAAAIFGIVLVQVGYGVFSPERSRLKQLSSTVNKRKPKHSSQFLQKIAVSLAQILTPKKGKEVSKIRQQLEYIGYTHPNTLKLFFGSKFLFGLIASGTVFLGSLFFPGYSTSQISMAAGVAGFIGMLIPNNILERRVESRRTVYRKGFPDSLDLLLVCVEAGLGLNAAIQRVSKELVINHPLLSEQYSLVNEEIRVGVNRITALRNFQERTQLEDAENLVSLLAQSMKYGTSIAETLRVFAAELRDKRIQTAEEQAAMVGTKLIFPLVLCIFPAFFIVIVGPAVLGVIKALAE